MHRLISPILSRRPVLLAGPRSTRRFDVISGIQAHNEARKLHESAQRILAVSTQYLLPAA